MTSVQRTCCYLLQGCIFLHLLHGVQRTVLINNGQNRPMKTVRYLARSVPPLPQNEAKRVVCRPCSFMAALWGSGLEIRNSYIGDQAVVCTKALFVSTRLTDRAPSGRRTSRRSRAREEMGAVKAVPCHAEPALVQLPGGFGTASHVIGKGKASS